MKFRTAHFLTLLGAACVEAQFLTINTPTSAVQCEPLLITWRGGVGKKRLTPFVIPGSHPGAPPIVEFGEQEGTSFTWDVNVSAGTSIVLEVRDSAGTLAETAPFTVEDSSDSSCL